MAQKSSRKLTLRIYKLNNLTMVKVNKAIVGDSPWDIAKSLTHEPTCTKIEYGKIKRFRKK